MRVALGVARTSAGWLAALALAMTVASPLLFAQGQLKVRLVSPDEGSILAGRVTLVLQVESDSPGFLQFQVDGENCGSTLPVTTGSYRVVFDTWSTADGLHTIQAFVKDENGDIVMSQPITIFIDNVVSSAPLTFMNLASSPISYGPLLPPTAVAPRSSTTSSQGFTAARSTTTEKPRVETVFSPVRAPIKPSCPAPDPFEADGGGTCKNGEWVPAEAKGTGAKAGSAGSAPSSRTTQDSPPTTAGSSDSSGTPSSKPAGVSCTSPDPFARTGGVGLCVEGTWIALWKPKRRGGK